MEPFVAEIRIFPFNFPPKDWAFCDGQILSLSQNTALFSLLGTTYGGDGKSNFALPNLRDRAPMQPGQGPGLSSRELGESIGSDNISLVQTEIPAHNHNINASISPAQVSSVSGNFLAQTQGGMIYNSDSPTINMNEAAIGATGGSQPHNNMMPYLTFNFCISMSGIFPQRS